MDNFTATVASVQEVHNITLLVRGLVYKADSYGSQAQSFRAIVERKYQVLNAFKSVFFNHEDAKFYYLTLPAHLTDQVKSIFESLRRALAIYGLLAMKHGISVIEPPAGPRAQPKAGESAEKTSQVASWLMPSFQNSLFRNLEHLRQSFDPVDWTLFGKDKIRDLLNMYDKHTERLRETVTLILLLTRKSGFFEKWDMATNPIGANLGITQAAERQNRGDGTPDTSFAPLCGKVIGEASYIHGYQTVEYEESLQSGSVQVVLEEHKFNTEKGTYTGLSNKERKGKELQSVRTLAWLLQGKATMAPSHVDHNGLKSMYTLECEGYIDRSAEGHAALVYRWPVPVNQRATMMTLHAFISAASLELDCTQPKPTSLGKPSLGSRFFMAHALATTLFSAHSSGWVHGKIWSRGILVFPEVVFGEVQEDSLDPYLVGWEAAWPPEAERVAPPGKQHEDTELEVNIYRHPDRFCKSFVSCENRHDIYALGVVLLEIGLWQTMSALFARLIEPASRGSRVLPSATEMASRLSRMARGYELKREMGEEYAKVVQRCLAGDFNVEHDDVKNTVLASRFRSLAVEPLEYGVLL